MSDSFSPPDTDTSVCMLPAYDEFLISYKDRSAMLPAENQNKAILNNGIFRPVIVEEGQVAGIWKQNLSKGHLELETTLFEPKDDDFKKQVKNASEKLGAFLHRDLEINHAVSD